MNAKNDKIAVFGNKSTYLTIDEFLKYPIQAFNPFETGQRLFIVRKPKFVREIEQNITKLLRISSCDRRYRLAKIDPYDVPKLHFNRATGTWVSDNITNGRLWTEQSQSKRRTNSTNTIWPGIRLFDECRAVSEEYAAMEATYIDNIIRRDMDEIYNLYVERRLNALLEKY